MSLSRPNPFPIPELDGFPATRCKCGETHSVYPRMIARACEGVELSSLRAALKSADPELAGEAVHRLLKMAKDKKLSSLEDGETPSGAWFDLEEILGNMLWSRLYEAAKKIVFPLLKPFFTKAGESFDQDGYAHAVLESDSKLRVEIDDALSEEVHKQVTDIVHAGEADIKAGLLDAAPSVKDIIEALSSSTLYYADNFFQDFVVPAVQREIDATLAEGPLARPNLEPIFDTLKERFARDSYFNLVANATTSRAYHYGYLKAAQVQGYTVVVLCAVIDARTTDICRALNGRQYMLADALNKYDSAARAQNTDELKAVAPWFKRDQDLSLDKDVDRFIAKSGVPIPPLHGFCRTTLLVQ